MQTPRTVLGILMGAVAVGLAGCGAQANGGGVPCPQIVPLAPQLRYPISGSTGTPDGNFSLVFGSGSSLPAGLNPPQLMPPSGTPVTAAPLGPPPNPLPSPIATSAPSETLYGSAVAQLAPGTVYSVIFSFAQNGPCSEPPQTVGTFTTR